jgi:hypothetical protein
LFQVKNVQNLKFFYFPKVFTFYKKNRKGKKETKRKKSTAVVGVQHHPSKNPAAIRHGGQLAYRFGPVGS